jgi:hypothetical protein
LGQSANKKAGQDTRKAKKTKVHDWREEKIAKNRKGNRKQTLRKREESHRN